MALAAGLAVGTAAAGLAADFGACARSGDTAGGEAAFTLARPALGAEPRAASSRCSSTGAGLRPSGYSDEDWSFGGPCESTPGSCPDNP